MQRWLKLTVLLAVLTLSLIGCGTAADSSKEQKQDSTATTKAAKVEPKNEQPADTTNAASENKPEQAAAQVSAETKETPTVQAPASTTKTNTNTNTNTAAASKTTAQAAVQTPAAPAAPSTPPPATVVPASPKPAPTVTLSIVGPKDKGTIMGATKVSVEDGDTIFTVLKRQKNVEVDSKGSGASTYIEGINNIYEFDYGQTSGWIFKVNGASIPKSVGVVTVKEGDRIECIYTE